MLRRARPRADAAIPTASFADIAFLLLVFFMVTAVFSTTRGLELRLPEEERNPGPRPTLFLHVRATDVRVDCELMEPAAIPSYVEERLRRDPDLPVVLYTDPEVEYRRMVQVYDLLDAPGHDGMTLHVPTRSEVEEYVRLFGRNPYESRCP